MFCPGPLLASLFFNGLSLLPATPCTPCVGIAAPLGRTVAPARTPISVAEPEEEPTTFRGKLGVFLESHRVHVGVVALVLLDCVAVVAEVLIDLSNCNTAEEAAEAALAALEAANASATHGEGGSPPPPHGGHGPVAEGFHIASVFILSIFLVEILAKVVAHGIAFFKKPAEVFDAVIVITSFALDLTVSGEAGAEVVELLLLLRMWRVTRILHGITHAIHVQAHEKLQHERGLRRKVEAELKALRAQYEPGAAAEPR